MRLAKRLAHAGVSSRRHAEELVRAGRVTVANEVVTDPARDVDDSAEVLVDGAPAALPPARTVIALHKPLGVVSTASDPQGRPTVVQQVDAGVRLYPVGRLDADSTGLILLTDDGDLAHRLMHPSFEVPKTYRALLEGPPLDRTALRALAEGVELEDGPTAHAQVRRLGPHRLEITIREGRKRQVRRMCTAVGRRVVELQRIAIGPLQLGDLAPGGHRRLSDEEVAALRAAARA